MDTLMEDILTANIKAKRKARIYAKAYKLARALWQGQGYYLPQLRRFIGGEEARYALDHGQSRQAVWCSHELELVAAIQKALS